MNAARFGHVAVLYGGKSAEREVSLASGNAVLAGLKRGGVDAVGLDVHDDAIEQLQRGRFDRAFLILHGRGGEDGTIQGALETLGMPYTGSGVAASALAMDKYRCKLVWQALNISTPPWILVENEQELEQAITKLGFPVFVKPVHEGSSVGVSPADDGEELHRAWFDASQYDRQVLVERRIDGHEYTAAIVADEVFPIIRLAPTRTFYDYEAKYADGAGTRYHCPCGLSAEQEQRLARMSMEAFEALGASGWGRVDLLCDKQGEPYFIDVNTAPGMTDHSLVPMAALAAGIDFDTLVLRILEQTL